MIMPVNYSRIRGQASLEYLLLLAVVAVVVIAGFGKGSLIDKIHDSSQGYYNTVTRVVMDSDGTTTSGADADNPSPIDGGWCPVTCPSAGSNHFGPTGMYRKCECPSPAFGGKYCKGSSYFACNGVSLCGSCPTGQVCLGSGQCGCSNNLDCSSIPNSSPDSTCTKCACNKGTYWFNGQCTSCPLCYTTNAAGTSCVPVQCPTNSSCSTTVAANCTPGTPCNECQCFNGTYWDQSMNGGKGGCTYCPGVCQTYDATQQKCVPIACGQYSFCDTSLKSGDPLYDTCECDCDSNFCTYWNGSSCSPNGCSRSNGMCTGACTPKTPCSATNNCGTDSCGHSCGTCSGNQTCSSYTSGVPGSCACTPIVACSSTNNCGKDSCGNSCGDCFVNGVCSSSPSLSYPGSCSCPGTTACSSCPAGEVPNPWDNGCVACAAGSLPAHSAACPMPPDNAPSNNSTNYKVVASCTSGGVCEAVCSAGYSMSGGACVADQCLGVVPKNAALCSNNLKPINDTTYYTLVSSCSPAAACQTTCASGFIFSGGQCLGQCKGSVPTHSASCNSNPPSNNTTPYSLVTSCSSTPCQAKCNTGYGDCDGKSCTQLGTNTNCSACGDSCSGGKTCQSNKCACPANYILYQGSCYPDYCPAQQLGISLTKCPGNTATLNLPNTVANGSATFQCSALFGPGWSGSISVSCNGMPPEWWNTQGQWNLSGVCYYSNSGLCKQ